MILFTSLTLSSLASGGSVHTHGEGKLSIAVDGKTIYLELEAPGQDIFGFESQDKAKKSKDLIMQKMNLMRKPESLFVFPKTSNCKIKATSLKAFNKDYAAVDGKAKDHHDHDHEEKKHQHKHGDHAEFLGSFKAECQGPVSNINLTVKLGKNFPALKKIKVQVLSEKAQSSTTGKGTEFSVKL
ncbi:ZrgA family zinc uptake protein [Pseudobacteriovorax antillogorgiicola]|nr:DUF2796 domain-containing protein [Pseudobacteriovorax antillogorgiicola]